MARKKAIEKAIESGSQDKRTRGSTQKAAQVVKENIRPKEAGRIWGVSYQKATSIIKKAASGDLFSKPLKDLFNKVIDKVGIKKQESRIEESRIEESKPKKKRAPRESAEEKRIREDLGLSRAEWIKQNKKIGGEITKEGKGVNTVYKDSTGETIGGHGWEKTGDGIFIYNSNKDIRRHYSHLKEVKKLPTKNQALKWLRKIGQAKEYFAIAAIKGVSGQTMYTVFDTRSPKERRARNKKAKGNQAGEDRAQEIKKGGK